MHLLIETLLKDKPIVLDGAWGTELQKMGLGAGQMPEEWNLYHSDKVFQVAIGYVEAGSQIILTNTFGANRIRLEKVGLSEKTYEINLMGAQISRMAAKEKALVFGSVGPTGKLLVGRESNPSQLYQIFEEQVQGLYDGKVDGIVIETMSDIKEALIALEVAKQTDLPVIVSMAFGAGKNKDMTIMGDTPEQIAFSLTEAGADGIGANCGTGIESFISICERLSKATSLPIWIKPNAGIPYVADGQVCYKTGPEEFTFYVPSIINAGAAFIGGCCGTTPDFIRAIRKALGK